MQRFFCRFLHDEGGATAIEYGLIASLISVVIITSVSLLGDAMDQTFDTIEDFVGAGNQGGLNDNSSMAQITRP